MTCFLHCEDPVDPNCMQVQCAVPDLLEATWEEAATVVDNMMRQREWQSHQNIDLSESEEFSLV